MRAPHHGADPGDPKSGESTGFFHLLDNMSNCPLLAFTGNLSLLEKQNPAGLSKWKVGVSLGGGGPKIVGYPRKRGEPDRQRKDKQKLRSISPCVSFFDSCRSSGFMGSKVCVAQTLPIPEFCKGRYFKIAPVFPLLLFIVCVYVSMFCV